MTEQTKSKRFIHDHLTQSVSDAIQAYGDCNQVVVAMEELCELSCALAKFVRYHTSEEAVMATKESVLSEMADVLVMLETITQIYEVDSNELYSVMELKLTRLDGWLQKSQDLAITTVDRELN